MVAKAARAASLPGGRRATRLWGEGPNATGAVKTIVRAPWADS